MGFLDSFKRKPAYSFTDEDREFSLQKRKLKLNKEKRQDSLDSLSGIGNFIEVMADIEQAKQKLIQPYLNQNEGSSDSESELIELFKMAMQQKQTEQQNAPPTKQNTPLESFVSLIPSDVKLAIKEGRLSEKDFSKLMQSEIKKVDNKLFEFLKLGL